MSPVLKEGCYLKRLEEPYIYDVAADELYLLDEESFGRVFALCRGEDDPEAAELLEQEGLLQKESRSESVYVEGRSSDPSLRYLEVQITGRCNKVCRHCYLGPPTDRDMEADTFSALLEEFSAMQGLKIMVSGGEPSCHPQFRELVQRLPDYPLRSILVTHGEWIQAAEAFWLAPYLDQVQVSLDGLQAGHDALRGAGSFTRATNGIRNLRNAGIEVSVATMAHEQNLDQFEAMSELVRELGVQEWDIDVPCSGGRWDHEKATREQLRTMSRKLRYSYGGGYHGGSAGLACGSHLMTVAPDGKAAKCGFYLHTPAGNIREGLAEVWECMRHLALGDLDCDCDFLEECAGGCRFRASTLEGSELARDVVQCYARGIK